MKIEVEFLSKELVKPSSPTPDHLRHLQLSFLDQIQAPVSMPFVLFYPKQPNISNLQRFNLLKTSLSKALTIFYPLAGSIKDNTCIDCNDQGVLFVEAQANCTLSNILESPNPYNNKKFFPLQLDHGKDFAAFFQITFFICGGLAVSVAVSHKLADGLSVMIFLNSWAAIARGHTDISIPPFGLATLFPPKELGFEPRSWIKKENIVTKRFVFEASVISALKAKFTDSDGSVPSRVEALAAFVWSRFMAVTQANKTDNKLYLVHQAVNLRPRMEPPLSNQHFGNISRIATALPNMDAKEDEYYGIISQMREAIRNVNAGYVKSLQKSDVHLNFLKEGTKKVATGEVISFSFTSLCKFPTYEINFGWGEPEWAGSAPLPFKNIAVFLDAKEGQAIEAWINLKKEDMSLFEIDEELLAHVILVNST